MQHPDLTGDAPVDPLGLMLDWLPPNNAADRPVMGLSTIDADGNPDCRTVLLSSADRTGLAFHTSSDARKVSQLQAFPHAALLLLLPESGRQLVVSGPVVPESAVNAAAAYAARSPYLQKLAWTNTPQLAQLPVAQRRAQWRASTPPAVPPPTWAGFVLTPDRLSFWTADPDGPSNRCEYRRNPTGWQVRYLPG
jgi:pyridoxamine 5'-phosphate oxidase